jgi:hypothetical protein
MTVEITYGDPDRQVRKLGVHKEQPHVLHVFYEDGGLAHISQCEDCFKFFDHNHIHHEHKCEDCRLKSG